MLMVHRCTAKPCVLSKRRLNPAKPLARNGARRQTRRTISPYLPKPRKRERNSEAKKHGSTAPAPETPKAKRNGERSMLAIFSGRVTVRHETGLIHM